MSTMMPFTDGCAMTATVAHKYPTSVGSPAYVAGKGRFGAIGLRVGTFCAIGAPNQPTTVFSSGAAQLSVSPSVNHIIWSAFDTVGNGRQVYLAWLPSLQLQFFLGNNTAIGSPTAATFAPASLPFLEIKCTIHPSAGLVELRINGNATPALSTSGINTRNTANTWTDQIRLEASASGVDTYWSDIIVFDGGGSAPNGYLGLKKIVTLNPNNDSATGGLNQFATTPSQAAGSHFNNVKEQPPDDNTSYNSDNTVGHRESYRYPNLPAGTTNISFINAWSRACIDDAGPHTYQIVPRNNAVDDTAGPTFSPGAAYGYDRYASTTDPNTSAAWTPVGFNGNAEVGVKILS